MGEVTIRLSEDLQAFVDDGVEGGGHPSAEAYIQALLEHEQARRMARIHELLEEGLASGLAEGEGLEAFDRAIARAKEKSRSRAG